ncbi:MAG: disulfide bond formation protein B [Candidatus Adiutrix sp.]|nr:disulfide bond formation protein B [Candidatus Adiutrix sp.]
MLKKMANDLKADFWGTLLRWQSLRPVWFLGGGAALFLEIFSWAFFQRYLGLQPCELCVYIRFSMLAVFCGAMFAAISPRRPLFRLGGYFVTVWAVIQGFIWDLRLEIINLRSLDDSPGVCAMATADFPFGLPLDRWLPSHFRPLALCGEDGWSLFGLNMAEWLFFIYGLFALGLGLMLLSWLIGRGRAGNQPPELPAA